MFKFSANLRALFDGPTIAHVATLLPDGAPHSVPVWVGIEGGQIAAARWSPIGRVTQDLDDLDSSGPPSQSEIWRLLGKICCSG